MVLFFIIISNQRQTQGGAQPTPGSTVWTGHSSMLGNENYEYINGKVEKGLSQHIVDILSF